MPILAFLSKSCKLRFLAVCLVTFGEVPVLVSFQELGK